MSNKICFVFLLILLSLSTLVFAEPRIILNEDFNKDQGNDNLRPWVTDVRNNIRWHYNAMDPHFRAEADRTEYSWGVQDFVFHDDQDEILQSMWCAYTNRNQINNPRWPEDDEYMSNQNAWMWWGPADLSEAVTSSVSFWLFLDMDEDVGDNFYAVAFTDEDLITSGGDEFHENIPVGISLDAGNDDWSLHEFDLDHLIINGDEENPISLLGEEEVYIAFVWQTDDGRVENNRLGAFIDDVQWQFNDNLPPVVVNPIDDIMIEEDAGMIEIADLDDVFENPDGDELEYAFENVPEELGMHIDEQNTLIMEAEQDFFLEEPVEIIVTAIEEDAFVSDRFNVMIQPVNDAPIVIREIEDIRRHLSNQLYVLVDLDDVFFDVDDEELEYEFDGALDEMNMNINEENELTVHPERGFQDPGAVEISVTATDPAGLSVEASFNLTIIYSWHDAEPEHFTNFVETGACMSILISELSLADEIVPPGWEIGIFTPNDLLAGGAVWVGEDTGFAVYADDPQTNIIDGFQEDEPLHFRVWDNEADLEYDTEVEVIMGRNEFLTHGFSFFNLTAFAIERELNINLRQGWNMISINIQPPEEFLNEDDRPDVVLMTEQLRIDEEEHRMILLKDEQWRFYAPEFEFNNIPYWNLTEGYQLNVDDNIEVSWTGLPIEPDTDIPISEGWNIIPYFPRYQLDASAPDFYVVSPILDHVRMAKDELGRFLIPEFNFSNMLDWREGEGYQICVDEDVVLNYPPNDNRLAGSALTEPVEEFVVKSSSNMSLLVNSFDGIDLQSGDFVEALDTDGRNVGFGIIDHDGRCGMVIWGDDPDTEEREGLQHSESFALKLGDKTVTPKAFLAGDELEYTQNDFIVIDASIEVPIPNEFRFENIHPNPFNSTTKISYNLPMDSKVQIGIYNLQGQRVDILVDRVESAGCHSITWNADHTPAGVYLVRMKDQMRKVVLVK